MPRRRTRVRSHVRHTAQGRVVVDAHARNLADGTRNHASRISTVGYTREGYQVYGSAYPRTYQGPFLTHSINRDLEKSLCRRVRFEHVIDDDGETEPEPSCSVCRARLGLPEKGANQARGVRNRTSTKSERAEHDALTASILRDGAYDDGGRHYQPTKLQAQRLASEAMRYERWFNRQHSDTHARDEGEME